MNNKNIKIGILLLIFGLGCDESIEILYSYNLIDINPSSNTYNTSISLEKFEGQVSLHYFGHQN